jgi:hypothetical protein
MLRQICWVLVVLGAMSFQAQALVNCTLTAVPLQTSSEGLAEPVGEVLLRCAGGAPNGTLRGTIQFSVGRRVANVIEASSGRFGGISLAQEVAVGVFMTLPVSVRLLNNAIIFEGLNLTMSPQGTFGLKMSGVRAEAGGTTFASLQFSGNEQLLVSTPVVTVAYSQPGLLATTLAAVSSGAGPVPPSFLDYSNMVASKAPVATVRVTEGFASAFVPWRLDPYLTSGARILVQLTGVPEGSRVMVPDAIAGSSALQPTTSGALGGGPTPGLYDATGTRSLLLVRVQGSKPDGSEGFANWLPGMGPQALFPVRDLPVSGGVAWAVFEVMDANPSIAESAQIPMWLYTPLDRPNTDVVVRSTVSLAPTSETPGSVEGAPIPRFRLGAVVGGDCEALGDCSASYWPRMTATPTQEPSYSAASGGPAQVGYILIRNEGGGLLEWKAAIRYRSSTGWLSLERASGFNNYTNRYDVNPRSLPPGTYEADIVVQQTGAPKGANVEVVIPVKLVVTQALPPPLPTPIIRDVLSPATNTNAPAAPGGVVLIQGGNFLDQSTVTVGGKPARVILVNPDSLTVELAGDTPLGRVTVYVANLDRVSQANFVEVIPVAPGMLFALNDNGERNGEQSPVTAGKALQLHVTGLRQANAPLYVKLHDLWMEASAESSGQSGIDIVRIIVPETFPTMYTAVMVCGQASGYEGVCSYPKDVWIKAVE